MNKYLFVFRGGDTQTMHDSPEKLKAHMDKWKSWIGRLAEQGHYLGGDALEKSGAVVNGKARRVTDGPYAEGKEVIGGYFVVQARDQQQAIALSGDCPVFDFEDGTVEVRPLMDTTQVM